MACGAGGVDAGGRFALMAARKHDLREAVIEGASGLRVAGAGNAAVGDLAAQAEVEEQRGAGWLLGGAAGAAVGAAIHGGVGA